MLFCSWRTEDSLGSIPMDRFACIAIVACCLPLVSALHAPRRAVRLSSELHEMRRDEKPGDAYEMRCDIHDMSCPTRCACLSRGTLV